MEVNEKHKIYDGEAEEQNIRQTEKRREDASSS
jgi:hypothetical protein